MISTCAGLSLALLLSAAPAAAQEPAPPKIATPEQLAPMAEFYRSMWAKTPQPSARMAIPLHGGVLEFSMPRGFVPVFRIETDRDFLFAFAPDGEQWPDFSRAVLVQSSAGLGAAPVETAELVEGVFKPESCVGDPLWAALGEAEVGSDKPAFLASTGCASLAQSPAQGQQTFVAFLRGNPDAATLSYAVRSDTFAAAKPPIDQAGARKLIAELGDIILCRSPEQKGCKEIWQRDQIRRSLAR